MSNVKAIRSQAVVPPATPRPESAGRSVLEKAADRTAVPERLDAPVQTAATAASVTSRLAERDESPHPANQARIAANAAREAYIRASIAAGLSPLPLP
jgi:hypothetical protein